MWNPLNAFSNSKDNLSIDDDDKEKVEAVTEASETPESGSNAKKSSVAENAKEVSAGESTKEGASASTEDKPAEKKVSSSWNPLNVFSKSKDNLSIDDDDSTEKAGAVAETSKTSESSNDEDKTPVMAGTDAKEVAKEEATKQGASASAEDEPAEKKSPSSWNPLNVFSRSKENLSVDDDDESSEKNCASSNTEDKPTLVEGAEDTNETSVQNEAEKEGAKASTEDKPSEKKSSWNPLNVFSRSKDKLSIEDDVDDKDKDKEGGVANMSTSSEGSKDDDPLEKEASKIENVSITAKVVAKKKDDKAAPEAEDKPVASKREKAPVVVVTESKKDGKVTKRAKVLVKKEKKAAETKKPQVKKAPPKRKNEEKLPVFYEGSLDTSVGDEVWT